MTGSAIRTGTGRRFWHKLKQYRRVATRYEKTAQNFLAFVHVASIMILLR